LCLARQKTPQLHLNLIKEKLNIPIKIEITESPFSENLKCRERRTSRVDDNDDLLFFDVGKKSNIMCRISDSDEISDIQNDENLSSYDSEGVYEFTNISQFSGEFDCNENDICQFVNLRTWLEGDKLVMSCAVAARGWLWAGGISFLCGTYSFFFFFLSLL
jgi:hypothetical protein